MSEIVNKAVICVTREKDGHIQVLVTRSSDAPEAITLPVGPIANKEHPCEAALRILGEQTGTSEYISFHKVKDKNETANTVSHSFHTTPEASLPDSWTHEDSALTWVSLQDENALNLISNFDSFKDQLLS